MWRSENTKKARGYKGFRETQVRLLDQPLVRLLDQPLVRLLDQPNPEKRDC